MTKIRSNGIFRVTSDFVWEKGYEFEGRLQYALPPLLEPPGPEKLLMSRDFEFSNSGYSDRSRNNRANQLSTSSFHCWWVAKNFCGNTKHRDKQTIMPNPTYAGRMAEAIIKQRREFRGPSIKKRVADWETMTRAYNDEAAEREDWLCGHED